MKKFLLFSLFFVILSAGISSHGADKLPKGPYQNTCQECFITPEGNMSKLTCKCQKPDKNLIDVEVKLTPCHADNTDLSCHTCENRGGALLCEELYYWNR